MLEITPAAHGSIRIDSICISKKLNFMHKNIFVYKNITYSSHYENIYDKNVNAWHGHSQGKVVQFTLISSVEIL